MDSSLKSHLVRCGGIFLPSSNRRRRRIWRMICTKTWLLAWSEGWRSRLSARKVMQNKIALQLKAHRQHVSAFNHVHITLTLTSWPRFSTRDLDMKKIVSHFVPPYKWIRWWWRILNWILHADFFWGHILDSFKQFYFLLLYYSSSTALSSLSPAATTTPAASLQWYMILNGQHWSSVAITAT